jgi:hypothetical protein
MLGHASLMGFTRLATQLAKTMPSRLDVSAPTSLGDCMVRKVVKLSSEQIVELGRWAEAESISLSEVIRRSVDIAIERRKSLQAQKKQLRAALSTYRTFRESRAVEIDARA